MTANKMPKTRSNVWTTEDLADFFTYESLYNLMMYVVDVDDIEDKALRAKWRKALALIEEIKEILSTSEAKGN